MLTFHMLFLELLHPYQKRYHHQPMKGSKHYEQQF